jgi:hypothetical protein
MKKRQLKERFLDKIRVAESGCHEWCSTMRKDGYGKFWLDGQTVQAHRAAWIVFQGEIPKGKLVLHKCDNRKCVNTNHLYIGTAKDNTRDKIERCRWWGRMKIPYAVVEKARSLVSSGWTQQKTADFLGIKQVQVSRYVRKNQRSHY